MKWKNYVEKTNAKTFVLPEGWDSRDAVAEELGCSSEKVNDHLRPGIASGEIEKAQFPVWSAQLSRKVMVWAYRHTPKKTKVTLNEVNGLSRDQMRAEAQRLKTAGKTWNEIGAAIGVTGNAARSMLRRSA